MCEGRDAVVGGNIERNKEEETFYLPCRTGRKVPW